MYFIYRTPVGTPIYRPGTHSPRHEQWVPTCTLQRPVVSLHYGLCKQPGGALFHHGWSRSGAESPSSVPGTVWCLHGHPLQHSGAHSILSTKRKIIITSEHMTRCALCLHDEWQEVKGHFRKWTQPGTGYSSYTKWRIASKRNMVWLMMTEYY